MRIVPTLAAFVFVIGCRDNKASSKSEKESTRDSATASASARSHASSAKTSASSSPRAAPPHVAPTDGKLAGKPFAPDVVLLLESSDGAKLGFFERKADRKKRERWKCEEPMIDSERETTVYRRADVWKVGEAIEIPLDDWSATGADFNHKTPGKATIKLTKKDAASFTLDGTIEARADDGSWKLSGPFSGEYCPEKIVPRENPEPLAGMAWSMDPASADKLPTSPVAAIIGGHPSTIAHATIRERKRLEAMVTELTFFADAPPDPCAERPRGGWLTTYGDDGHITSRDGAKFRDDSFSIYLAAPPKKGDKLTGVVNGSKDDRKDAVVAANLEIFEADAYRSGLYDQYFSTAIAIDDADDQLVKGRVYLALPDNGKSHLVGAFEAKRCPPLP